MAPEDVRQFFTGEMTGVLRLALHLTADAEKAETCLILAMRECLERSTVSKEWLPRWARRMVVRNAIRLVLAKETKTRHETGFAFYPGASDDLTDSLRESAATPPTELAPPAALPPPSTPSPAPVKARGVAKPQAITFPAESVLTFKLLQPLTVVSVETTSNPRTRLSESYPQAPPPVQLPPPPPPMGVPPLPAPWP